MKDWNGKRYHSLNYFLRNKYGEKIYKIPLDGGFTCPNRDGKVAKEAVLFVVRMVQEILQEVEF